MDDGAIRQCRGIVQDGADASTMAMLYDDVSGALTSLIRSIIEAPAGKKLVVADYSSIESVMAAWCAESEYLLDLFRSGRDPYKDFATKIFNVKYEDVTKKQRTIAKPCVLGGQYGLGAAGLQRYAEAFGITLSINEAQQQIDAYRKAYADIPVMWVNLERAVFKAVQKPHEPVTAGRFTFLSDTRFLILTLPSGRALYYRSPSLEEGRFKGKENFHYLSRGSNKTGVHSGLITENIVQSVSRDLLAEGMLNVAMDTRLTIVGHVHDEILALADEDDETDGHHELGVCQRKERLVSSGKRWTGHHDCCGTGRDTVHVAHPFICASTAAATVASSA
jgi:DNA polymerase